MLGDNDAIATIAVANLQAARTFYGDTLGLQEQAGSDNPDVITYRSGHAKLLVYRSPFAGTNQATVVTWTVDDVEPIARALKSKGVAFEHYDVPLLSLQGDMHVADNGFKVVWFKDPDGNILSMSSGG